MVRQAKEVSFSVRAVDRATATIRKINKKLESMAKPVERANKAFQIAERRVAKYTRSLNAMSAKFRGIGMSATLGLTLPIAAIGTTSIRTAAEFEHSMTKVKALTQGDMFETLKSQARDFGATTMHSASAAADAMVFYSMAGFKAQEIFKTMPSTLNLATAATEELATTADIVANVIRGYDIPLDRVRETIDMLTGGFSSAKMDLETLGESLVKTSLLKDIGVPFSENLALIGTLRTAGVDPASTGTALAGAASRLINPVKEVSKKIKSLLKVDAKSLTDSNGQLGSFVSLIERLERAGAKPADFMTIFGQEAGKFIIKLLGSTRQVRLLQRQIEGAMGKTDEFAKAFQSGATGAMYGFRSAVEAVQISIGESGLLSWFTEITFGLTKYIQDLSRVNPAMIKLMSIIGIFAGFVGPALLGISVSFATLASSMVALKFASVVATMFGTSLAAILGLVILKIGLFIGAISAVVYAGWFLVKNWKKIADKFSNFITPIINKVKTLANYLLDLRGPRTYGMQKFEIQTDQKTSKTEELNFIPNIVENSLSTIQGAFSNPILNPEAPKTNSDTLEKVDELKPQIKQVNIERTKELVPIRLYKPQEFLSSPQKFRDSRGVLKEVSDHKMESSRIEKSFSTRRETHREINDIAITIDFEHIPKGTRIETKNHERVPLKVNMGWAMDGAR